MRKGSTGEMSEMKVVTSLILDFVEKFVQSLLWNFGHFLIFPDFVFSKVKLTFAPLRFDVHNLKNKQ